MKVTGFLSLWTVSETTIMNKAKAGLVAKPRFSFPLLLWVKNVYDLVSNNYNDRTFSYAFVMKTCFLMFGKLFVEQSLCNRFRNSSNNENFKASEFLRGCKHCYILMIHVSDCIFEEKKHRYLNLGMNKNLTKRVA